MGFSLPALEQWFKLILLGPLVILVGEDPAPAPGTESKHWTRLSVPTNVPVVIRILLTSSFLPPLLHSPGRALPILTQLL